MKTPLPLILIIDDEATIRDGCRQTLEKSGYAVREAGEGAEGIRIAHEAKPEVALIDLKMPGMSGMEIIDILSRDLPDTVLIMITGYATIVSAVEAIQKGTYDYLPKPFSPDQLRAVVRRAIEHRDLKIETRRLRSEKERMEKSFITFVSHEMRSPLVVIRQYIEAIKSVAGDRLEHNTAEILEKCSARIQGLEAMVEHWLDISRIADGSFAWKKEPLNLIRLLGKSMEEMTPLCKEKAIRLTANLPEKLPAIVGDEESLLRVFTNVIGNAIKYTPENGRITVSARCDDYYAMVSISDTGAGIPADKLPFVFEPFYRVRGKEERQKGSGLGLTFCKKIMELHDGEITVESRESEGSTFALKFPSSSPGLRETMKYDDAQCYRFHERDLPDRCFVCSQSPGRLLIVRQIDGMMLVHLCPDCMLAHVEDYLLDNTRPWTGAT